MSTPVVELRGLVKRYGARRALAGIDLTLTENELVGVVGPDGAGKTTLLRSLVGLLEVTAERARVLGYDLTGDVTALKARVGYVAQTFSLHPDLSVLENLRFTARLHRLTAADWEARVPDLLARTGLAPFGDRPAGALSGGMRQKLAVANALLPVPDLLVLDEPTAGVDVVARHEIWTLLAAARARTLVVLATSYLDEAARCDRLLYLDTGRVVAFGTPHALQAQAGLVPYRAWGDDGRAIARAARALPYVRATRATRRYARVEVASAEAPASGGVLADLRALAGAPVRFAEALPVDMESTLLALSSGASA